MQEKEAIILFLPLSPNDFAIPEKMNERRRFNCEKLPNDKISERDFLSAPRQRALGQHIERDVARIIFNLRAQVAGATDGGQQTMRYGTSLISEHYDKPRKDHLSINRAYVHLQKMLSPHDACITFGRASLSRANTKGGMCIKTHKERAGVSLSFLSLLLHIPTCQKEERNDAL